MDAGAGRKKQAHLGIFAGDGARELQQGKYADDDPWLRGTGRRPRNDGAER
jgi:hypothetical protein